MSDSKAVIVPDPIPYLAPFLPPRRGPVKGPMGQKLLSWYNTILPGVAVEIEEWIGADPRHPLHINRRLAQRCQVSGLLSRLLLGELQLRRFFLLLPLTARAENHGGQGAYDGDRATHGPIVSPPHKPVKSYNGTIKATVLSVSERSGV